jgi:hypothetical protein
MLKFVGAENVLFASLLTDVQRRHNGGREEESRESKELLKHESQSHLKI